MWVEIPFLSLSPASSAASLFYPNSRIFLKSFSLLLLSLRSPKQATSKTQSLAHFFRLLSAKAPTWSILVPPVMRRITTVLEVDGVAATLWEPPVGGMECTSRHKMGAITVVWAVIPIWDEVGWWHLSEHLLCGSEHELWGMGASTLYDSAFAFLAFLAG